MKKTAEYSIKILVLSLLLVFGACKKTAEAKVETVSNQEVREMLLNNPPEQLIDVRTAAEFEEGHLQNAKNISVTEPGFEEGISGLDKNKPVYLYCRSGKRSARAAEILKEKGFMEVYDMTEGYIEWDADIMKAGR